MTPMCGKATLTPQGMSLRHFEEMKTVALLAVDVID